MDGEAGKVTRRNAIGKMGLAAAFSGGASADALAQRSTAKKVAGRLGAREQIEKLVNATPLVDSHEHLFEEEVRLKGPKAGEPRLQCDDWTFILSQYANSDLINAGMPRAKLREFFSPKADPVQKWDLVEPYWTAMRNTGYGQAVDIAVQKLYGVDGLSRKTVVRVQEGYRKWIQPGFYRRMLHDLAGIESCQVNGFRFPFTESKQPAFLMQDLSFVGMHLGPDINTFAPRAGIEVKDLADWHAVIDWWFSKYGPYAVAVKSQAAYRRSLDYQDVPAEKASPLLRKKLGGSPLSAEETKSLEDHLFWYAVRKATEANLPVKIHTGYLAGENAMPLGRVRENPVCVTEMCRKAPDTKFVFMHVCYPYFHDLIAAAKQYSNAYLDMCWAWILSPVASVSFLKEYLLAVPANKIFTFGGDFGAVEPVVGHAHLARHGITRALTELVEEGWLTLDSALGLVEPLMCGNARRVFRLEEKARILGKAPWL